MASCPIAPETLPRALDLRPASFTAEPFPHALIPGCCDARAAEALLSWFETDAPWSLKETDFYEQFEFSMLEQDGAVPSLFNDPLLVDALRSGMEALFGTTLDPEVDIVAHKLVPGQRIGIHNDYLVGQETHRLIVQLNRGLPDPAGGLLMLFNSEVASDVARVIRPLNRSGFAFAISDRSFHAVSRMHEGERFTLVYSFRASCR